jgi:hypothetical protein
MRAFVLALCTTAAVAAIGGPAQGAVTIGSKLTGPADEINPGCGMACTVMNTAVPTDTASGGLASPVNGSVTSWQFKSVTAGGSIALRILRPAGGNSFTGAGTSAPVTPNGTVPAQGPFSSSLPIRVGDFIGLNATALQTPLIDTPASELYWNAPTLADNQTAPGTAGTREVAVQAVVEPSNTVTFAAPARSKKKGTATVTITVPNGGQLSYTGTGVSVTGPASVGGPGDVQLTVRATGKKAKKLKKKGKVSVSFGTTFTPNFGAAGITPESLTLRKKHKRK